MDGKKSNVVRFPKAPFRAGAANDAEVLAVKGRGRLAAWAVHAVRYFLFLVLYWLRGIIRVSCGLVSLICLALGGFAWFAFPELDNMAGSLLFSSFVAFVVMWFYDRILMWLSPVPMMESL
ncbi:hypothetical protein OO256_26785 [Pseudomonas sp. DCB_CB]|uniref:hypothetical protein n=1 Tax=unclassified Pseudomonas TaxID=196821 RepID=UPI0022489346|nr:MULTISPECIES: hypothetical protein [unclassified Pseudomonas]MCX2694478.1 hypothetical protein [Pseudomonas sp. DCB_BZ]MCX2859692.1 hypothetical protein [Pseudomonas sp. DCB_CB]